MSIDFTMIGPDGSLIGPREVVDDSSPFQRERAIDADGFTLPQLPDWDTGRCSSCGKELTYAERVVACHAMMIMGELYYCNACYEAWSLNLFQHMGPFSPFDEA